MACLKLPLPSLPPLPGLSFTFTLPGFGLDFNFCCHFSIINLSAIPIRLPPIPIIGPLLVAINTEIQLVDAFLQAIDLSFSCPFDDGPDEIDSED